MAPIQPAASQQHHGHSSWSFVRWRWVRRRCRTTHQKDLCWSHTGSRPKWYLSILFSFPSPREFFSRSSSSHKRWRLLDRCIQSARWWYIEARYGNWHQPTPWWVLRHQAIQSLTAHSMGQRRNPMCDVRSARPHVLVGSQIIYGHNRLSAVPHVEERSTNKNSNNQRQQKTRRRLWNKNQ